MLQRLSELIKRRIQKSSLNKIKKNELLQLTYHKTEMYRRPKQYLKLDKRLRELPDHYSQRSILKSTRQKNWLSIPGKRKKRVTFHNSVISKKIKAEKKEVTMVKSDKLDRVKRSGISPFLYTPETFPDDHPTQNIETTENGSKIKTKMRVLEGDEAPEQFMVWLKDYEDKIFANEVLRAPAKLAMLRRLVDEEAQTILSKVEKDYKEVYSEPDDVELLSD